MRFNTTLFTVGVLLGTALADIRTIKASMKDIMYMANNLSLAITDWSGTASSGGNVLCKTVAFRKSLDAGAKAFRDSKPLKTSPSLFMIAQLGNAIYDLKNKTIEAKKKLDGVGATASLVEIIKAQKAPASDMSKAIKDILDKLPPSLKDLSITLKNNKKVGDLAPELLNKEIDDLIKQLQPQSKPLPPQEFVTPAVLMAAQFSKSIDTDPFCRSIPNLMNTLAGQSIKLGVLTNQALKVLKSSRVQNVSPLDVMKKGAEAFGMPPNFIPNTLKKNSISEKGLPLLELTNLVPRLLSTNLRTLNNQTLKILDLSRVQDEVVPLGVIRKGAEAFGVSRDITSRVLKKSGFSKKDPRVRDFTKLVPKLLDIKFNNKALGDVVLGDMVVDTPTIIHFADSAVKKVLGSTPR